MKIVRASIMILGGLLLSGCGVRTQSKTQSPTPTPKITLGEILRNDKNQKCEWVGENAKGTVYAVGKNWGEITSGNGQITNSYFDGEWVYNWNNESGWKTKTADMDKVTDFKCNDWSGNLDALKPPKNINFDDMSKQVDEANKIKQLLRK